MSNQRQLPHPSKEEEILSLIRQLKGQVKRRPDGWDIGFQFRGQNLGDRNLAKVVRLPDIVSLNLRDTRISNAGLVYLKSCPRLQRLHLERTQITDSGLIHLAQLSNLEYLNLYGTNVSDKGIQHLDSLKNLGQLFLWGTKVTEAGVEKLNNALPDLEVSMGIDLTKIVIEEEKKEPEVLGVLEWLPVGGDISPPDRSVLGVGTRIVFINQREKKVKVYWIDYGGGLKQYGVIEPGEKREQNTFSKAVWMISDVDDNRLGYFVSTEKESTATIPAESLDPNMVLE